MIHPSRPGARRIAGRVSFSPFRIASYVLHATGLERFYKPRFMRETALMDVNDELVAKLPRYCHTITGAEGDPMNLVFVGRERELKRAFRQAGWHRANPASPIHVLYGAAMALFKRSYNTGPFAPLYVNIALQDLAYQRSAGSGSFRERHHLRIWRTGIILPGRKRVWVGAAGREDGMKFTLAAPFWSHTLDPDLDKERRYIVETLESVGARRLRSVQINQPAMASSPKRSVFGSDYYTDGRAEVVEV